MVSSLLFCGADRPPGLSVYPYKQKRRTRATMAREKGLEPLARLAFAQGPAVDMEAAAQDFVDPENEDFLPLPPVHGENLMPLGFGYRA